MAETGLSGKSNEKSVTLKRKRNSTDDEEVENMPPKKMTPKVEDDQPAHNVIVESSCSSDEDEPQYDVIEQPRSVFTDLDYNADSFLSPPSSELPHCVLSPLENVARGECTPHSNKRHGSNKSEYPSSPRRKCPLPGLSWADPSDVWKRMCEEDSRSTSTRNPNMFDNHPCLQPRMRAILLDWLNEVCEVYKLHRETFHLTVDYVDRYLSNTEDVQKGRLQLIGITCLFVAAKVEEVYPPKIAEFAYVTDGACTAEEILLEELLILKILSWDLTPITVNNWLNVYMQLASESKSAKRRLISESDSGANALRPYTFVFPQYSSLEFVICGQLIDLAILHVDVNTFNYSMVAAAAISHTFDKDLALRVSGYSWEALEPCHRWLTPFVEVVRAEGAVTAVRGGDGEFVNGSGGLHAICPDLNVDESHRIQSHNISLDMFVVNELAGYLMPKRLPPPMDICNTGGITDALSTFLREGVLGRMTPDASMYNDKVYQHFIDQSNSQTDATPGTSQGTEHAYPPTPPASDQKSPKTPSTKTPSTRHQIVAEVRLHVQVD